MKVKIKTPLRFSDPWSWLVGSISTLNGSPLADDKAKEAKIYESDWTSFRFVATK